MTKEEAIEIAKSELGEAFLQKVDFRKALQETGDKGNVWVVMFTLKDNESVIVSPDTVFVEVSERTGTATIISHP